MKHGLDRAFQIASDHVERVEYLVLQLLFNIGDYGQHPRDVEGTPGQSNGRLGDGGLGAVDFVDDDNKPPALGYHQCDQSTE